MVNDQYADPNLFLLYIHKHELKHNEPPNITTPSPTQ